MPTLRHIVNLWSIREYPTAETDWPLERKLEAAKAAGFDGFTTQLDAEHGRLAQRLGLEPIGYFASGDETQFADLLASQRDAGAHHVNVQLADHDTPTVEALRLTLRVLELGETLGLEPAIEVHRDTCTETPEKAYALADAYQQTTGQLLPMTWDHSHLSVVKHLGAGDFIERLLVRPDLVQRAQQFHLRPFNGHHCQVPVTGPDGAPSPEVRDWLPFAEALMRQWLAGPGNAGAEAAADRVFYAVPEMGPTAGGYNLHGLPNSWEDAARLRPMLAEAWTRAGGW